MSRALFVAGIVLAAAGGYLAGRATVGAVGRSDDRPGGGPERSVVRRRVSLPAEEVYELRARSARLEALELENESLRAELEKVRPPSEEELPVGSRRPDGSIVGGARWQEDFVRTATGFLDLWLAQFIADAKLTDDQAQRVRDQLRVRINEAMQITAEFTNGDVTGDQAYEEFGKFTEEGHKFLRGMLDERQLETYFRFEGNIKSFMHQQVVHNEMETFKAKLGLDSEQERKIRAIIEKRYDRVQSRIGYALPNVMFTPMRREQDADIYRETSLAIRRHLSPEQVPLYEQAEKQAMTAVYAYRQLLVPKGP